MHPPNQLLPPSQYKKLVQSYKNSIYHMKRITYQIDPHSIYADYFYFLEAFEKQIRIFSAIDSNVEFNRLLAQPLLMCPFLTEELQQKI